MRQADLPTTPPPLDQRIEFSTAQQQKIEGILSALSRDLDGSPVILSQQGEIIAAPGIPHRVVAERLTRSADRLWRHGAQYLAREVIRFEEESIEEIERANYMLYSAHIEGAVTLTIGWQTAISLTQIRAEVADVKDKLLEIFKRG